MTSPTIRPVVFIGSSSEGLPVARALQLNLDHDAEVILWSQGVFGLSEGSLESLVNKVEVFDFAVLILTPDDLTLSRGVNEPSPRDNVVFEVGLFMGALGRTRCFLVYDRTAGLKLPSDLAGITPASYEPPTAGSFESALGASSTRILTAIQAQGRRQRENQQIPIEDTTHFRVIADLLEEAALQFFILMREAGAVLRREERFDMGLRFEYATISEDKLDSAGNGAFDVSNLCRRLADAGLLTADLRGRVSLSERGRAFAEWLVESGYKADYFWSDIGTWGERPAVFGNSEHPRFAPRNVFELQKRAEALRASSTIETKPPVSGDPSENA